MRSVPKSCALAAKIASIFVVVVVVVAGGGLRRAMAMAVWAWSMLVGFSIVDSLIDSVACNLGFGGVVHIVALKTYLVG